MAPVAAPTDAPVDAMDPNAMVLTGPALNVPVLNVQVRTVPVLNVQVRHGERTASVVPRPNGLGPAEPPATTVLRTRSTMPRPNYPAGPLLVLGPTTTDVGRAHPLRATGAGKA
jgi:hypothetical protein